MLVYYVCNVASRIEYSVLFYISTFRSVCAVLNVVVFCSSFISCFSGRLLRYFLNAYEMTPVAPIITVITIITYLLTYLLTP